MKKQVWVLIGFSKEGEILKVSSATQVYVPTKQVKSCNYRPTSEMPSRWRFSGGPIVAHDGILAESDNSRVENFSSCCLYYKY